MDLEKSLVLQQLLNYHFVKNCVAKPTLSAFENNIKFAVRCLSAMLDLFPDRGSANSTIWLLWIYDVLLPSIL